MKREEADIKKSCVVFANNATHLRIFHQTSELHVVKKTHHRRGIQSIQLAGIRYDHIDYMDRYESFAQ